MLGVMSATRSGHVPINGLQLYYEVHVDQLTPDLPPARTRPADVDDLGFSSLQNRHGSIVTAPRRAAHRGIHLLP
jgi:hypothetical protein